MIGPFTQMLQGFLLGMAMMGIGFGFWWGVAELMPFTGCGL